VVITLLHVFFWLVYLPIYSKNNFRENQLQTQILGLANLGFLPKETQHIHFLVVVSNIFIFIPTWGRFPI